MVKAIECTGPGKLRLAEFPLPDVSDDCLLVKVYLCGICGTDMHGIEGRRDLKYPVIPGHEIIGRLEGIGREAVKQIKVIGQGDLKVGDKVTVNPRIVCGRCYYCQHLPQRPEMCVRARTYGSSIGSGQPPNLFGGWAEYLYVLPGSEMIKLPEDLDDDIGVLCEPLACAVGCVDRWRREHDWVVGDGFAVDRTVVIYGAGTIGIFMAASFYLTGARHIIMIDVIEERLTLSKEFGVTHTINASFNSPGDRVEEIKELTDGLGADIVVEACGVPQVITEAVELLRRGGKLFEMGHLVKTDMAQIDPRLICRNEIEILGHYAYPSSQNIAYAARVLLEHKLPYEKLVRKIPLAEYDKIMCKEGEKKVVKTVLKTTVSE